MTLPARGSAEHELPLVRGTSDDPALSREILGPLWTTSRGWWLLFGVSAAGTALLLFAIGWTVAKGIGTWGNDIPVAWAYAITNFVWWIGIGHAGTFISAFLLLLNQRWRGSVNRLAEAMTIFALVNAGLFPILHLGRPWFAYWLIPYPATMGVWPNFKSSLPWDVAAVTTYFTVSLLFWYLGLVPDLGSGGGVAPTRRRFSPGLVSRAAPPMGAARGESARRRYSPSRSAAASAAPTIPASFSSWAGTIGVRAVSSGTHFSAFLLTPPPTMMRSGQSPASSTSR